MRTHKETLAELVTTKFDINRESGLVRFRIHAEADENTVEAFLTGMLQAEVTYESGMGDGDYHYLAYSF